MLLHPVRTAAALSCCILGILQIDILSLLPTQFETTSYHLDLQRSVCVNYVLHDEQRKVPKQRGNRRLG